MVSRELGTYSHVMEIVTDSHLGRPPGFQYPTAIAHHVYKLGRIHGHAKISYTILSMGLPEGLLNMMQGYLNYGKMFKIEGFDY